MVEPSFTEPQPTGKSDLDGFKKKYQGLYLCIEDSSLLTISESKITQEWRIEFSATQTEVDTSEGLELTEGELVSEYFDSPIEVVQRGDSIFGTYQYAKTLFEPSDGSVLRYFKGRYFLNTMKSENNWKVQILELTGGVDLSLSRISGNGQIESLSEITEVVVDSSETGKIEAYHLTPSRKELKDLLKKSKFNRSMNFVKVK
jgi:hypothetical protein